MDERNDTKYNQTDSEFDIKHAHPSGDGELGESKEDDCEVPENGEGQRYERQSRDARLVGNEGVGCYFQEEKNVDRDRRSGYEDSEAASCYEGFGDSCHCNACFECDIQ